VIRGPVSQRLYRAGRLVAAAGDEAAAIHDEEILNIMRAVVFRN